MATWADQLFTAVLTATPIAAKNMVLGEERSLGHGVAGGHEAALVTAAAQLAAGVPGDAFRVALQAACDQFKTDLDDRYHHDTPPHPSGLAPSTFGTGIGTCCAQSAASGIVTMETNRGHYDGVHIHNAIAPAVAFIIANLGDSMTYQNALSNLVTALDARYVAGVTTAPVLDAGRGLHAALDLMVAQAVGVFIDVTEGANGHSGHCSIHRTEAIAAAQVSRPVDAIVADVMTALDARYHFVGDE